MGQVANADSQSDLRQNIMEALFCEAPGGDSQLEVTLFGPATSDGMRYFLYADVLQELVKAARYRSEVATAILIGQFAIDEEGPFVEITAFGQLKYLYGSDSVELTQLSLEQVHRTLTTSGDVEDKHIVGVFVASPDSDAALQEDVARLHLSLFNMPYQVALVIDGTSQRLGLYARPAGKPFSNVGFHLVERAAEPIDDEVSTDEIESNEE